MSRIGNGQIVSPNSRVSGHNKMTSPGRYAPKSFIQNPTSPRVSAEGLPLFSQLNPITRQEN